MGAYIVRRLILAVVTVFGILVITFILSHVIPACPAVIIAGRVPCPEVVTRIRTELGLDKPLHQQFFMYITRLSRFDLGVSFISKRPVIEDLLRFFPATLELVTLAAIVLSILGISTGVVAAVRQNSRVDHVLRTISVLGASMPPFWLAIMLVVFAFHFLPGFPIVDRISREVLLRHPLETITGLFIVDSLLQRNIPVLLSALQHLILPVLTLTFCFIAGIARVTRAAMIEVLSQDYIRTAEAVGVRPAKVIYKYALKNCLGPSLTLIGMLYGFLLGGVVLVEMIFAWPGIGRYVVTGIFTMDFPVIMGVTVISGICFVFLNLFVDILYSVIDPRVTYT